MTDARHGARKPRYLDALGQQFSGLEKDEPSARRIGWPGAALSAAAALVLVVFLTATSPGRSVAAELGELVGIGDEPTKPGWEGERGVVIGVGEAAETHRYEIVAQTNGGATCMAPQFPDLPRSGGAGEVFNCLTADSRASLPKRMVMPFTYPAPEGLPASSGFLLQGTTIPEVAAVAVTYQDHDGRDADAAVSFSRLDEELSRKIGAPDQAGFFLAFLPEDIVQIDPEAPLASQISRIDESLSSVEVVAEDAEGTELLRKDLGDEEFAPWFLPPEEWCPSVHSSCAFEVMTGRRRGERPAAN